MWVEFICVSYWNSYYYYFTINLHSPYLLTYSLTHSFMRAAHIWLYYSLEVFCWRQQFADYLRRKNWISLIYWLNSAVLLNWTRFNSIRVWHTHYSFVLFNACIASYWKRTFQQNSINSCCYRLTKQTSSNSIIILESCLFNSWHEIFNFLILFHFQFHVLSQPSSRFCCCCSLADLFAFYRAFAFEIISNNYKTNTMTITNWSWACE